MFTDALINKSKPNNEKRKNQDFISQKSKNNYKKRHQ